MRAGGAEKKLAGAGRHWAGGAAERGEAGGGVAEALKALGAPPEIVQSWLLRQAQDQESGACQILEECWPALELFLAAATQWRYAGMAGVPIGLDYAALPAIAGMIGQAMTPELFADLREIEAAAGRQLRRRWKR